MNPVSLIDELHHNQSNEETVEMLQESHLFWKEVQPESKWICQKQTHGVLDSGKGKLNMT
jgi:hypothetical protein